MIPILLRQNIKFKFFLISQTPSGMFNRGKLLNAGFIEVSKRKVRAQLTILLVQQYKNRLLEPCIENSIVLYSMMLTYY